MLYIRQTFGLVGGSLPHQNSFTTYQYIFHAYFLYQLLHRKCHKNHGKNDNKIKDASYDSDLNVEDPGKGFAYDDVFLFWRVSKTSSIDGVKCKVAFLRRLAKVYLPFFSTISTTIYSFVMKLDHKNILSHKNR